jgi:tetratricopeptide (TPR) repeat protein
MAALAAAFALRSPDAPPAPLPVVTPVRPGTARPVPPVPLREILRQARAAAQNGSMVEAAILFRKALEIDDRDAETWNNLGVVLVFQGQSSEGIDAFRRAVRLAPRHAEANRNLAVALDREGKTTAAIAHYRVFLANAGARHSARESVSQRLADLGGSVAGASSETGADTEGRPARRGQAR